ncbi:aldehyde oxidase, partial [Priestia megaterium]
RAASSVHIQYEPLSVVHSPSAAIEPNSPLVHENMHTYKHDETVYPEPGTNVANRVKIRKGNMEEGWSKSELVVEETFSLSPSDHAAMETRSAAAEILPNGVVKIITSSQAPFMVKKLISEYFEIEAGKVIVETPLVGGGYGGKAAVQLELLAYLASKAVGGRLVKILNTREEDMLTSPVHIGLDAKIKLGCSKEGLLQAADILYLFDSGAYADKGTDLSKAAAADCTGPYRLEHIFCDSLCVYTNHPYASPFRGFSHSELLFAFERTMDILAKKAGIDPLEFREKNAILPGDTTPTQVRLTSSSVGNLPECIRRLKQLIKWEEGQRTVHENGLITAKGISCVWKTSTIETDAGSGVILTFNPDGSVNLMSGVIELG